VASSCPIPPRRSAERQGACRRLRASSTRTPAKSLPPLDVAEGERCPIQSSTAAPRSSWTAMIFSVLRESDCSGKSRARRKPRATWHIRTEITRLRPACAEEASRVSTPWRVGRSPARRFRPCFDTNSAPRSRLLRDDARETRSRTCQNHGAHLVASRSHGDP